MPVEKHCCHNWESAIVNSTCMLVPSSSLATALEGVLFSSFKSTQITHSTELICNLSRAKGKRGEREKRQMEAGIR